MQAHLGSAKKQATRLANTATIARCTCQAPSRRASTSAVTLDDPSFFFYPSYTAARASSPRSHSPSRNRNRSKSRYSLLRRYESKPLMISSRHQVAHIASPLLPAGIARSQSTTTSESASDSRKGTAIDSSAAFSGSWSQAADRIDRSREQPSRQKGKEREVEGDAARSEAEADARQDLEGRLEDMHDETGTFKTLLAEDRVEEARRLYDEVANDLFAHLSEFPPHDEDARQLVRHLQQLLSRLIKPYVAYSDSSAISDLLSFFEQSFQFPQVPWRKGPTTGSYNMLLQTYVQQLNVERAFDTFERIKRYTLGPTVRTWTLLVTLYSHKRDPESARNVFEQMISEGVRPTQHAYTALMNAYTEAGQWNEAVDMFKFLDDHSPEHPLKPDIHTWTTLVKAYVLMGAPIENVLNVYREILERGLQPQARTFTLVLQAACDSGMTDLAEEIFAKMDSMRSKHTGPVANVYSFSVMIRGLLRAGQRDAAEEYYKEMLKRGITPTSATWSILITAYAKGNESDSSQVVEQLLDEFMATYINSSEIERPKRLHSLDPNIARGTALQSVYGPVITAYAQMANIKNDNPPALPDADVDESVDPQERAIAAPAADKALRSLQDMLRRPRAKPSIATYTALLDAYRRVDDTDGMLEIWKVIVELALSSTSRDYTRSLGDTSTDPLEPEQASIDPSRRNLLCLPLSIVINGLSANHRHDAVAQIWAEVQNSGFGFDASNFNKLAVAFVRAGELHRAFWTVETLLLQPELEKEETQSVDRENLSEVETAPSHQQDKLDLQTEVDYDSELTTQLLASRVDTPIRPPNRAHELQPDYRGHLKREHRRLRLPELSQEHLVQPTGDQAVDAEAIPYLSAEGASDHLIYERTIDDVHTTTDAEGAMSEEVQTGSQPSESVQETQSDGPSDLIAIEDSPVVPVLQENITSSFQEMAKARKKALWKAHAATLTELEMALLRLERRASHKETEEAGNQHMTAEEAENMADQIRRQYPLTLRAIEHHRAKLDMVRGRMMRA